MTAKSTRKKFIKFTLFIIGILIVLLIGFHFWFKAHARQILEDLVENKSNGKLKMKVGKLKYGYFSNNMEMADVLLYNTDTINENTSYKFKIPKIKLKAKGLLAIIFKNQFLIDSLSLYEPDIEVTRLNFQQNKTQLRKDVSIPEEMGKIYKSIQDGLSVLKVSKFRIEDGRFTLINKIQPEFHPIEIGKLNFQIDNFLVDTGNVINKEKILFSDNVILTSSNQDIILPDSRHRISYKFFNINLKKKLVEFDSCTLAATQTDNSNSSFNIFFDKLLMANIDFDTLYKAEVIKADSVYCVNPKFNLKVEIDKTKQANKEPLKLENIIKQLTGDLLLANVVVSNADFNIETIKDQIPNSFTFTKNNFEMEGLKIDQSAKKPINVDRFAMAIRNYENFIKDSSYSIKFDSILFKDDRISLSNFLFEKLKNGKRINSFRIPQFYLGGLSWDDLVFEKKLKADQATMYYPDIIYTVNPDKRKSGKQNIFQSLGAVNEFMDLNNLEVINGNIDLTLKKNLRLKLFSANLSIESNSLLSSTKISTIKNSLKSINFKNGKLLAGEVEIELNDLNYIRNTGHFNTSSISLQDKTKAYNFLIKDVTVDKMIVDELTGNIDALGIVWKKGNINFNINDYKNSKAKSSVLLKNIKGENTTFNITKGGLQISSIIDKIYLDKLESQPRKTTIIEGLKTTGSQLKVRNEKSTLAIDHYNFIDNGITTLNQVDYSGTNKKANIEFHTTSMSFIPTVQTLLNGDIILADMVIEKPTINFNLHDFTNQVQSSFPYIKINSVKTYQPQIKVAYYNSGKTIFNWDGAKSPSSYLEINDININAEQQGVSTFKKANVNMSDFEFIRNGKLFYSDKGNIVAAISNIALNATDKEDLDWRFDLNNLSAKQFHLDSFTKNQGDVIIKTVDLKDIAINSKSYSKIKELIHLNDRFQIANFSGNYKDKNNFLNWSNASYNRLNNNFSVDSTSFSPSISKDSFLAKLTTQKDYITFKTSAVNISQLNPDLLLNENLLKASAINIKNAEFTAFKDKNIPFKSGIIKPLPVSLLKKIPFNLSIDKVEIDNGNVLYSEIPPKSSTSANIPVTRMKIRFSNIKNFKFDPLDTLSMDVTGYLLDTAWAHLNVKESYNDLNGGFLLKFQVAPSDLTIINPILIALSPLKLTSGFLDTLDATVIGHEKLATGEMKLYYNDLKIKFPKKLKTFIANTFVIKKKNTKKTSPVFFIRDRDRSAINYYVKIIGSGVASSIGAKNNKKLIRKYKKEQKKNKLPSLLPGE